MIAFGPAGIRLNAPRSGQTAAVREGVYACSEARTWPDPDLPIGPDRGRHPGIR